MAKINIGKHLKKPYWQRRINKDNIPKPPTFADSIYYFYPLGKAETGVQYLTQEDFLNELSAAAHEVNSDLISRRPIYKAERDDKGKVRWKVTGFDPVEKVSLGLPECLAQKKASHFGDFWIANETDDTERFERLLSWIDSAGLKTGYLEAVLDCFKTGDSAIYLYRKDKEIRYKVFSILKGDTLFYELDSERNPVLYRKYALQGQPAVDIISTKYYETWVQFEPVKQKGWLENVSGWFKGFKSQEESEDGYRLVSRTASQVSEAYNQAIYFRIQDVPWGPAFESIKSLEKALSFVAEDVKSNAFPMLFMKATNITSLPRVGNHERVIAAKGTAEEIANADVKTIQPADMSNIATTHIRELATDIVRTSMTVFVEPEILKAGADSSTTIKIMFTPEIQWCKCMWPQFYPQVKDMMEVFKQHVGNVEEKISEYAGLRTSTGLEVWIPQNDSENVDIITKKVYAGILSEKNARLESGNQYLDDYEVTKKEREEQLYRENFIPTKAKAQAEQEFGTPVSEEVVVGEKKKNPYKPASGSETQHIDNNSDRKNVATQRDKK